MEPVAPATAVLSSWMGILDANRAGNVFGGRIMSMCDEAGAIAAIRHSRTRVVTAAMDEMRFRHPILIGHLVILKASVNAAWRSSMEVGVRVETEDVESGTIRHASSAFLTFVALDPDGRPAAVPPLAPSTYDERRREQEALIRRRLRLEQSEAAPERTTGGDAP